MSAAIVEAFDLQWHADKAGNTDLANGMFRLLRRHETWYRKDLAEARRRLGWASNESQGFVEFAIAQMDSSD